MDNSLLSLIDNNENTNNIDKYNNIIMNYSIGILINILLFINYNNIYINLLIFILLYSIIYYYLKEKKNIINKHYIEKNNILLCILFLTFIYDLLNIFEYNKTSFGFIFLNISLICVKILIIHNVSN